MLSLGDCILPAWPAPPGVRALVTTRRGGVSRPPFHSLNLGIAVGDDPAAVAANRSALAALLPAPPRWLKQVHGARVVEASAIHGLPEADASYTSDPNVVCVVQAADCLPVLMCDGAGTVVAAAHAGWRGLAAGVLEITVSALGCPPASLIAWIGPGIGPGAFEVGPEVLEAFAAQDPAASRHFRPGRPGKWYADLEALAVRRLHAAGVGSVHASALCTYSDANRFFSHRRDGTSGRMAALIWRTG